MRISVPDPSVLVDYELPLRLCDSCYATGRYNYDPLALANHRVSQLAGAVLQNIQLRTLDVELDEIDPQVLDVVQPDGLQFLGSHHPEVAFTFCSAEGLK